MTVRMEQKAFGIGVFAGLMSASVRMRQKKTSRSRFVKDVVTWPRKLVVSRSGQGSREVPGPSVPSRVRSVPSRQMSFWKIQVRTRMGCRLLEGRVTDFAGVSLQRLDPSEWTVAAFGGFFHFHLVCRPVCGEQLSAGRPSDLF